VKKREPTTKSQKRGWPVPCANPLNPRLSFRPSKKRVVRGEQKEEGSLGPSYTLQGGSGGVSGEEKSVVINEERKVKLETRAFAR